MMNNILQVLAAEVNIKTDGTVGIIIDVPHLNVMGYTL